MKGRSHQAETSFKWSKLLDPLSCGVDNALRNVHFGRGYFQTPNSGQIKLHTQGLYRLHIN